MPSLVYPREGEATTLSSVNKEEARKEIASSLYLKTGNCNLGPSGESNTLPDEWVITACRLFEALSHVIIHVVVFFFLPTSHQNFREIPQASALTQKNKTLLPTASKTDLQLGRAEADGPDQKIENQNVKESPQQRLVGCKAKTVRLSREVVDARDRTQPGLNIRTLLIRTTAPSSSARLTYWILPADKKDLR